MKRHLGRFLLCSAITYSAQAASGAPPVVLPRVQVVAAAPLLEKVAEYKMREPRFGAAVAAAGDFLYISGGSNAGNWALDSVERLDLRTGASEAFARLERARLWHRAIVYGRKMYILGGAAMDRDSAARAVQRPSSAVELVDLNIGLVTPGPDMPDGRRSFGCVLLGGRIYVFGGYLQAGARLARTNSTLVFDVLKGRWWQGPAMPTARETEAVLVDGPFVVLPGGYNGVQAVTNVECFNPRDESWQTLPSLCRQASAHSVAFLGQHLFLFGDYDAPEQCLAYDLRTRKSEVLSLPFQPARHNAAVVHRGRIYVVGGRTDESPEALNVVQVFALKAQR